MALPLRFGFVHILFPLLLLRLQVTAFFREVPSFASLSPSLDLALDLDLDTGQPRLRTGG